MQEKPLITLRCGKCGAIFENIPWTPGDACGRCGAANLAPLLAGESDYSRADRSSAYALEDIRFGRLALWAGWVTAKQVQWALHQQKEHARARQRVPDIGALLMREKIIDRRQFDLILGARRTKLETKDDADFIAAAARMGALTADQVKECRALQVQAERTGHDVAPLPLLAVEKRYLQENAVQAILKSLERDGCGMLMRFQFSAAEEAAKSPVARYFGAPGTTERRLRVALAILLPIAFLLFSFRVVSGPAATAAVKCKECGAEGGAPASSKWPVACPDCNRKGMEPLVMCRACGTRFAVANVLGYGVACPKCRSSSFIMITNKNAKERTEIEAQIKGGSNRSAPPTRRGEF